MIPWKVGKNYSTDPKKKKIFSYKQVEYDKDGWVDATKYLPEDGDLLEMKVDGKIMPGWSHGMGFDGLNLKKNAVITHWKHKPEERVLYPD